MPTIKANTTSTLGAISATDLINVSLRVPKRIKKRKIGRPTDGYSIGTVTGHYLSFLKATLDKLFEWICAYGMPSLVCCDQGKHFNAEEMKVMLLSNY